MLHDLNQLFKCVVSQNNAAALKIGTFLIFKFTCLPLLVVSIKSVKLPLLYCFSILFFSAFCRQDIKFLVCLPRTWKRATWKRLLTLCGLIFITTYVAYSFDFFISEYIREGPGILPRIGRLTEPFGMVDRTLPSLGCLYLVSFVIGDKSLHQTTYLCTKSLIIGGFLSSILKMISHRWRPKISRYNPYIWTGPSLKTKSTRHFSNLDLSFPSGHSTTAVAMFTAMTDQVVSTEHSAPKSEPTKPFHHLAKYLLYCLGLSSGIARVIDHTHWPSDVFFGACLGGGIAQAMLQCRVSTKGKHENIAVVEV